MSSEQIKEELEKLRSIRRLCYLPLATFIIFGLLGAFIPKTLVSISVLFIFGSIALSLTAFIYALKVIEYVCPSCGNHFHVKAHSRSPYSKNMFARKCVNCGLKLNGTNVNDNL